MSTHYVLEISVEALDAAIAAERGGAQRIELCENLSVGGATPRAELMRAARTRVKLPIFAMIRPRGGDFLYSTAEFERMMEDLEAARACGMDGVVLGVLRADRTVDVRRTRELVQAAQPLPVTFHRAFDETADVHKALQDVIATGATRLLTSGGKASAAEGGAALAELVKAAGERITILPGGGINAGNLELVVRQTGANEFHSGLGTAVPYPRNGHAEFEREVRKLAEILGGLESAKKDTIAQK
jgi:copper homeostasis protein